MTGEFAKSALEFVEQVIELDEGAEICDLLVSRARELGFEHVAMCDLPAADRLTKLMTTWPTAFRDRYCETLYRDDPLVRHAKGTIEPFAWSQVTWDHSRGSLAQRVFDEAAEVGLEDGFVVPVIGIEGDQSAIGLSGRKIRLDAGDRNGLHMMGVFAHYALSRRRNAVRRMCLPEPLSTPQRDTLRYVLFAGRSKPEQRLSRFTEDERCEISHTTCARFGARNIVEAGCMAFMRGEISP